MGENSRDGEVSRELVLDPPGDCGAGINSSAGENIGNVNTNNTAHETHG